MLAPGFGDVALKKRLLTAALAVAAIAVVVLAVQRWRTSTFHWDQFAATIGTANWFWLSLSIAFVLASYGVRALRWQVMIKPLAAASSVWRVFVATCVGFTAVVLFGRAGEPVRPYLIARGEGLSFSSQIAAWIVERIFDLLMVLIIFSIALTRVSQSVTHPGPRMRAVLEAGGYTAGVTAAVSLALLLVLSRLRGATLHRWMGHLKFLPHKVLQKLQSVLQSFETGMQSIRSASATILLALYTILLWLLIAGAFGSLCRAFPATAGLGIGDVLILLGVVAFGNAVQIPGVGGGMQVAAMLVLTELFGVALEPAGGIVLVMWLMTLSIVPVGLVLAFHAGIKFGNLRNLDTSPADNAGS